MNGPSPDSHSAAAPSAPGPYGMAVGAMGQAHAGAMALRALVAALARQAARDAFAAASQDQGDAL